MKKLTYIILITGFIFLTGFGFNENDKVVFHETEITASSVILIKWNIVDTSGVSFVQETIDNLGRTKELKFYNYRHQLAWTGSGFYGGPIIKYDYKDNLIIETFFSTDSEIANDFGETEVPYRFIYHLNDENQIIDTEAKYKIDFELTKKSLDETIKQLQFYKDHTIEDWKLDEVFGYTYAIGKLHGINPKLKE